MARAMRRDGAIRHVRGWPAVDARRWRCRLGGLVCMSGRTIP